MGENDSKHTSTSSRLLRLRQSKTDINLEFKPLVQVDPSIYPSARIPLKNPRVGDYQLKQIASTEGIASKKSLELKKRYLLGENVLTSGIMKSDSTSMLDSKLKIFHNNISDCQKLLNPAPDISPALQSFLKTTIANDGYSLTGKSESLSTVNHIGNNEEKENVYKHIVNTKNELNKSDNSEVRMIRKSDNAPMPDKSIFENTKEPSSSVFETIDLVTPEKNAQWTHSATDHKIKIMQRENHFDVNNDVFIDLTGDTSLERLANFEQGDSVLKTENEILQTILSDNSFVHSTAANNISISANRILKDAGNSSSKSTADSSSSSSPAGIPHHILESTTNTSADATPIEPNELMQMDSLMIIDGKYTGDPEDLRHMKMPEIMKYESKSGEKNSLITNEPEKPVNPATRTHVYESIYQRPELKFDTRNENKIDSLRNLPLILPKQQEQNATKAATGLTLNIGDLNEGNNFSDNDRTPTVSNPGDIESQERATVEQATQKSDSETETTGCICTETELSDWTADDAVSENFVDIEFALNSNKGTLKRNRRATNRVAKLAAANQQINFEQKNQCPIVTSLDFDGIDFMDTGSEESCMETYAATNDAMLKNRGYVQFINTNTPAAKTDYYNYETSFEKRSDIIHDDEDNQAETMGTVEFVEQGACVSDKTNHLKKLAAETSEMAKSVDTRYNEVEDESIVMISSQGGGNTTTEESEALTIVTSPLESTPRNYESNTIDASKQIQINEDSDDITYGDYVRQLQIAITQISNARDSIDIRKMKRKHSTSEVCAGEQSKLVLKPPYNVIDKHNKSSNKSLSIYVNKLDEPASTVIEKLEELTKERTKQKDLIHDLVMNKLQSKKQLNAEKRLNRSRNRSSALSLSPVSNALPPPPPSAATTTSTVSSISEIVCVQSRTVPPAVANESNCDYDNTKACKDGDINPKKVLRGHQRPLSDNVDTYFETPKLNKTKSFCAYENKSNYKPEFQNKNPTRINSNVAAFSTPMLSSRKNTGDMICQITDELRLDARQRARLMSNQELGLSPEDKFNLLGNPYKTETVKNSVQSFPHKNICDSTQLIAQPNKSDDMKVRERKMLASKSVNDIAATSPVLDCDNSSTGKHTIFDSTSDSNLNSGKPPKRRQKDPERRRSIIQAVSEFFHKKKDREQPGSLKEKNDSMFGLFRISPKTKSKVDILVFFLTI